jgi:hypothetical protein
MHFQELDDTISTHLLIDEHEPRFGLVRERRCPIRVIRIVPAEDSPASETRPL